MSTRELLRRTACAVPILLAAAQVSHAAPESGCAMLAADRITLSANASASYTSGAVPLRAGETLRLDMQTESGEPARGTVLIVDGGEGSPVLSGAAPQQSVFTVPMDGLYSLEYRAESATAVNFSVACESQITGPSASPEAYAERRAARLLSEDTTQTSLQRRASKPETIDKAVKSGAVMNPDGSPAQVTVSTSVQDLAAAEGKVFVDNKLDVWVEGRVSQSTLRVEEDGSRYNVAGDGGTLFIGSDYLLGPGLMIGGLLQIDHYQETYDGLGGETGGGGVMFGPYASARLAPDVFFDARAAWGNAENKAVMPDGTRVSFDTERQLLRGQLTGKRSIHGIQITPSVALAMIESRFSDPDDLPEGSLTENSALIGRLGIGSGMSYRIALEDGAFLQPNANLSTGWNVDHLDSFALADAHLSNDAGAKAEAGLLLGTADGISIQAIGAIEGIGKDDYSAWSGRLSLTAPLN